MYISLLFKLLLFVDDRSLIMCIDLLIYPISVYDFAHVSLSNLDMLSVLLWKIKFPLIFREQYCSLGKESVRMGMCL